MKNTYLPFDPVAAFAGDKVLQKLSGGKTREVRIVPSDSHWFSEYGVFSSLHLKSYEVKTWEEVLAKLKDERKQLPQRQRASLNIPSMQMALRKKASNFAVGCLLDYGKPSERCICLQSAQLTMSHPRDPDTNYGYEDFDEFDWGKYHQAKLYRQQLRFERT
jgi:hypothetical protein